MMMDITRIDYSSLDRPEILRLMFYPRPEIFGFGFYSALGYAFGSPPVTDVLIPVEEKVVVGARFHITGKGVPNILFFHGNGEIVSDYDYLGLIYNGMGINFLPVDYRGYGRSTGEPTVTAIMRDSHVVFEFVGKWLEERSHTGPLIVMGRSLGSAPALELASNYKDRIDKLIIESGFAYTAPLLQVAGIDVEALGLRNGKGFRNVDKIQAFDKPTLLIHAELDQLIPFTDGQALYEACLSREKKLVRMANANHYDIFLRDLPTYLSAVRNFVKSEADEDVVL